MMENLFAIFHYPMRKRNSKEFWWTAEKVQKMGGYYARGYSMQEIAAHYKIKRQRVSQLFDKFGIETRSYTKSKTVAARRRAKRKIISKEVLIKLYEVKKLKIADICEELKISVPDFYRNLKLYGIQKRNNIRIAVSLTPELLYELYIAEKLTANEIARKLGYAPVTVKIRLSRFGIRKSRSAKKDFVL